MDPLPLVEEDSVVYVIQEAIPAAKGLRPPPSRHPGME